jgi:hypothetical protein
MLEFLERDPCLVESGTKLVPDPVTSVALDDPEPNLAIVHPDAEFGEPLGLHRRAPVGSTYSVCQHRLGASAFGGVLRDLYTSNTAERNLVGECERSVTEFAVLYPTVFSMIAEGVYATPVVTVHWETDPCG